jgi:hypothetical protein
MRPTLRWCVGAVLLAATWAFAQPFTGTWAGPSGQVRLTQEGQFIQGALTVEGRGGPVHGSADGEELVGLWAPRGSKLTIAATLQGAVMTLTVEGTAPITLKRVPEAKRPAPVAQAAPSEQGAPAASPAPAVAAPVQALKGGLCAESDGPGPTWTRRLVFDGRGHLAVGADVAPVRRGEASRARQFWVEDVGAYRVKGSEVSVRVGSGEQKCLAGSTDATGRVTEMLCGGWLYDASTCQAKTAAR